MHVWVCVCNKLGMALLHKHTRSAAAATEEGGDKEGIKTQKMKKDWKRERARGGGESQPGNWWSNCWLLLGSYLGCSGLLSARAGFQISLGLDQTWQPVPFFLFFLPLHSPSQSLFGFLSLSLSFISFLSWTRPIERISVSPPPPIPPFWQPDITQRAAGWKRAAGEVGVAASRGSEVSLQQDKGRVSWWWWGVATQTQSPPFFVPSPALNPDQHSNNRAIIGCEYSWAQRGSKWGVADEVLTRARANDQEPLMATSRNLWGYFYFFLKIDICLSFYHRATSTPRA